MYGRGFIKMRNPTRKAAEQVVFRQAFMGFLGAAMLLTAGCSSERDENDGRRINSIVLPTDVVLNLYCEDVGVAPETCVLEDPENPYVFTSIPEFDPNSTGPSKFDLANQLPPGPDGAKARFYFWATALARRSSGENQYFTALALHELFTANSNALSEDELVRNQTLKAYRSVLDNFFSSVLVFTCFECSPDADGNFPNFTVTLNERVADHLFRTLSTATAAYPGGLRRLIPGDPTFALQTLLEWGYSYQPCTDLPNCTNGVVSVAEF